MTLRARLRAALSLRDTQVGRGAPRWAGAIAAAVAVAAAALDLGAAPWFVDYDDAWPRIAPALVAIAVCAVVVRDRSGLGLTLVPRPSAGFWLRATLVMAALFAVIVGIGFAVYIGLHGARWPANLRPPDFHRLGASCVHFPLVEELIYRWALVTGLAALGLRWTAVVISGVAFGYLHVRYGVAAGNNVAAGFVFAWMYLRSGSIAMPVAYHALGNLLVLAGNVAGYRILVG